MAWEADHLRAVRSEFSRQAESFASSATLRSSPITQRIGAALGDARLDRVLDLACGPGVLAPELCARADRVIGVDYTARVLELARSRCAAAGLSDWCCARSVAEATPFVDGAFDAVVLRLALHHFVDPGAVLREARRILAPGGRLVVLDILTSTDPHDAMLHNAIERLRDPSHTLFLPECALVEAIGSAGFGLHQSDCWATPRSYADWAGIIAEPARMDALEVLLRELVAEGVDAGIALREQGGALWFTYQWGMFVGVR